MHLDKTQLRIARGMALALLVAILLFFAVYAATLHYGETVDLRSRLKTAALSSLVPALTLFFCITRLAKHRFVTPEDVDGSAQALSTKKARILQSLLQNTLEQVGLALPVYVTVSVLAPSRLLALVPAAAAMFLVGRVLFFVGYARGAPSRAFGFALTFYPTVMLLLLAVAVGYANAA